MEENVYDLLNITASGSIILWSVSLVIFFIFVVILAVRISKSINLAAKNNGLINQYLAAVPTDKIGTVDAIYRNTRKSLGVALILSVVGAALGLQRIYLGKRKSALMMFLFFWTGIPAVISLFDMADMPKIVSEYNLGVMESLYNQLAGPKIDQ